MPPLTLAACWNISLALGGAEYTFSLGLEPTPAKVIHITYTKLHKAITPNITWPGPLFAGAPGPLLAPLAPGGDGVGPRLLPLGPGALPLHGAGPGVRPIKGLVHRHRQRRVQLRGLGGGLYRHQLRSIRRGYGGMTISVAALLLRLTKVIVSPGWREENVLTVLEVTVTATE